MPEQAAPSTCYRHADRVTYVRCIRCDRLICGRCQTPAAVGFQCPDDVKAGNATVRRARAAYGGRARERPDVTYVLLGLNVAIFLLTLAVGGSVLSGGDAELYRHFAMQPVALMDGEGITSGVADGQWWRLLTAGFLHYGVLHLGLNMAALYSLGPGLEQSLGRLRFLALYLLCALAGNAASYAFGPENVRAAGASGALYGLVGAALVLSRRRGEDLRPLLSFLVLGVLLSVAVPQIDLRAHAGGFLAGLLGGVALFLAPPGRRRGQVQALGMVVLLLLVVAVVAARTQNLAGHW